MPGYEKEQGGPRDKSDEVVFLFGTSRKMRPVFQEETPH